MQFYNEEILFSSRHEKFSQQSVVPGSDVDKIDAVFLFLLIIYFVFNHGVLCEEYFDLYNTRMIRKMKYLVGNDVFPASISAKKKNYFFTRNTVALYIHCVPFVYLAIKS